MSQITHGIRSILSVPIVYSFFQNLMGANKARAKLVSEIIKPKNGMNVLDIGCGPAEILDFLGNVNYWGFDISEAYINQAKAYYGTRAKFYCKYFSEQDVNMLEKIDVVIMIGVLHHLDDSEVFDLLNTIYDVLKIGGRLITLDACYIPNQNPIAKYIISKDRGQNIRKVDEYTNLMKIKFNQTYTTIRHQSWIPYTHCCMVSTK
jgi:ubiquinone/menaquinone biosynthesis C-methylase UbiE